MKPRLLDLFCGAGGCSVGYARAGFEVVGLDVQAHPDYPFELYEMDALTALRRRGSGWSSVQPFFTLNDFDIIHASPPCQRYSRATRDAARHPDLLAEVRDLLRAWGGRYVIENVPTAPMVSPVLLCGAAFNLGANCKDGMFESNQWLMSAGCACSGRQAVGVYGHGGGKASRHGYSADAAEAREAMGIDWMTKHYDVVEAVPPAYTEFIGEQLMAAIEVAA